MTSPPDENVRRRIKIIFDHLVDKENRIHTLANFHFNNNVGISGGVTLTAAIDTKDLRRRLIKRYFQVLKFYTQKYIPENMKRNLGMFLLQRKLRIQHFNMIETLIVITIIVAFSGLTGAVMARKYEEAKVYKSQIEMRRILESLIMFFSRTSRYPIELEELLENGDLSKVPMDPWGYNYTYIPHVDWGRLSRLLLMSGTSGSAQQLNYFTEALKKMKESLSHLPDSVEPIQILTLANEQPFVISTGSGIPRFPPDFELNVSTDKMRNVAQLIKLSLERSSQYPELNEQINDIARILRTGLQKT